MKFYILNYNNNFDRRRKITSKLYKVGIDVRTQVVFSSGIAIEDVSEFDYPRAASCIRGHLQNMQRFLQTTDDKYGVFMEDDIWINSKINFLDMTRVMEKNNLDVLLLGYLINNASTTFISDKLLKVFPELWGTQAFMISRAHVEYLVDKYYVPYSNLPKGLIYSADHILTKVGNNAAIWPPLVGEMPSISNDYSHFKMSCFNFCQTLIGKHML